MQATAHILVQYRGAWPWVGRECQRITSALSIDATTIVNVNTVACARQEALNIFTEFLQTKMGTYTAILLRGEPTRATCEAPDASPPVETVLLFLSMLSSTKPSLLAPPKWEWESYRLRRKTRGTDGVPSPVGNDVC